MMTSPDTQEAPITGGNTEHPGTKQQNGKAGRADSGAQVPPAAPSTPTRTATIVAVVVMVVYIAALWVLFVYRADKNWDRMVYLLSGFEAIVFVAVGAIFGTTVQRASVTTAQAQAEQARTEASAARDQANTAMAREASGAALAAGVRSVARSGNGTPSERRVGARERPGARDDVPESQPDLVFLVNLADELFPPGR